MTTVQRDAIASPADGLIVFDTDLGFPMFYSDGGWRRFEANSIEEDLTLYVDGSAGDDANDGLTWGTAKQTFGFLIEGATDAIPREINAALTVEFRNDIRARDANGHFVLYGFYGSGSITFQGVLTAVETFTASGYENDRTVQGSRQWVSDATKSWTPDQWRRHFVDLGHSIKYPIRTNNATTLFMGFGDDQAGSYAATIYSAPELLAELVTNPGVKYDFAQDKRVAVQFCTILIVLKNAWIDEEPIDYYYPSLKNSKYFEFYNTALGPLAINYVTNLNLDGCYSNLTGYGAIISALGSIFISNSAIDSTDSTGWGLFLYHGVECTLAESWVGHQTYGLWCTHGSVISLNREIYIQDCEYGITLEGGAIMFTPVTDPIIVRFDTITVAAIIGTGSLSTELPTTILGWDCAKEIVFSDTDEGSFADFSAQILNSRVQIQILYTDDNYYPVLLDEYDNTTSGLTATRYQTAIDELANRVIVADETYYVDGDVGDDANDGLAWGTAKKTFAFLRTAYGEVRSSVTFRVYARGTVLSVDNLSHLQIKGFSGAGTIEIIGEPTVVVSTLTPTAYQNTSTAWDYHAYVDVTGAAWTPNEYQGRYIKVAGDANYYPILSNTTERLWSTDLPNMSGATRFDIVDMTIIRPATVATPGTLIPYSGGHYVDVYKSSIANVVISNFRIERENRVSPQMWIINEYYGERVLCQNVSFEGLVTLINAQPDTDMYLLRCFVDIRDFGSVGGFGISLWGTCLFGYDGGVYESYGVGVNYGSILSVTKSHIVGAWYGFEAIGNPSFCIETLFRDCLYGMFAQSGTFLQIYAGTVGARFKDCPTCIVLQQSVMRVAEVSNNWVVDNCTTQIWLADDNTALFSEIGTRAISNASTSSSVIEYDYDVLYEPTSVSEYDNTISGLVATRYQTAIDELVADLADGPNYAQEVTVAKAGAQYGVIQGALDSIIDAATDKKYVVRVFPGEYDEEIVSKDNVDVVGIGPPRSVVIRSSTGTPVTMSNTGRSDLRNLTVERLSSVNDEHTVEVTAGTHLIYDCVLTQTSTDASGCVCHVSGTGVVQLNTGQVSLVQSGAATGSGNVNRCVHNEGSGLVLIRGINAYLELGDAADNATAFDDDSGASGSVSWQDCFVDVNVTVAGFAGSAVAVCEHSSSVDKNVLTSRLRVRNSSGDPSGIGAAYRLDSDAGGARVLSAHNLIDVTGFASNYLGDIGTGDVLVSEFNAVDAVNGCIGAGSVLNEDGVKLLHGVVARSTAAGLNCLPTHITTTTFTLGATANPIPYFYNGIQCVVSADKTATLDDGAGGSTAGLYFVYFVRATGVIAATKTFPGLAEGANVLIAAVYWNGTNYGLVTDERHSYKRNQQWHEWAHFTVGARYYSGFDFVPTGTGAAATFTMSGGDLYDEDIAFSAVASSSYPTPHTLRTWYQTGATTYTFDAVCGTTPFRAGAAGRPTYVNETGYVLTEAASAPNRYFNFFIYGVADMHTPTYCFAETVPAAIAATNGYTSEAAARAARFPALNAYGLSPELRPLYRLLVRADGLVITLISEDDYRRVTTLPLAAGSTSTSASAVTFIPAGTIASTNVQLALEELDSEKAPIANPTFTGTATAPVIKLTTGAVAGKFLTSSADGTGSWADIPAGVAAGSTGYIQFNTSNALNADAALFWDNGNKRLGVGTALPAYDLHVEKGGADSSISSRAYGNGFRPALVLYHAQGTAASPTNLLSGDYIGTISFGGHNTTGFGTGVAIHATTSQIWGPTARGSQLTFFTTPNNSTTILERVQITNAGVLQVGLATGATGQINLLGTTSGTVSFKVADIAGTWSMTLPVAAPASTGYVLSATTAGVCSWVAAAAATAAAGSTGYIQFNTTNAFNADAALFWDNTSKRLGIGNVDPNTPIEVSSNTAASVRVSVFSTSVTPKLQAMRGRGARGASCTPVLTDDTLGTCEFMGVYQNATNAGYTGAYIAGTAANNWSPSSTGASLNFYTTTIGTVDRVFRMRIADTGYVGIGTTIPEGPLEVVAATNASNLVYISSYGTGSSALILSRGKGTAAAPTAVLADESLGAVWFNGYYTSGVGNRYGGAYIQGYAAENWTSGATGTYITFGTAAKTTSTRVERMRITDAGVVQIGLVGGATGQINLLGTTSGTVSLKVADAAGTWSMTLPTAVPASTGYVLSATTGGVCSWVAQTAAGANTALSNLAAVAINTHLLPGTNDGATLGNASFSFSDLYLASGGVINWANSDSTITHSTGILTFSGCKIGTGGELAPDVDPGGICINHGAGDDASLTIKNSDVAHPFTTYSQTDTYLEIRKHVSESGGALIRGFTEATTAFEYRGYSVTASTGDYACIQLTAYYTDGGTGVTDFSANSHIVGFRNNGVPKHFFNGGGDAVFVGALTVGARVGTSTPAGTMQWSGTHFQGYTGTAWVDLDVVTPTTITVADTTDTTCFVALFESATGNLAPKTDAALLYNAGTGALSSTLFAADTITANLAFVPDINDGATLGTTALQFSDVFIASGGVINWADGNVTLTQSSGILTLSAAKFATGGETAPDVDAGGICINHGANDGFPLSFKNSDVNHPFTSLCEADTYLRTNKTDNAAGGANIIGLGTSALGISLLLGGMTSSPVSGASDGAVCIVGYQSDGGTSVANLADTHNLAAFRNWATTKVLIKGSGDIHTAAGIKIGAYGQTAAAGAVQWSGTQFQGYDGAAWRTFDNHLIVPADHAWSGTTMSAVAGETVALGDLCYLKSDGKFWLADADAQATADGMLAIATAAIAGDATGVFLLRGLFRDDTWAWTVGGKLYISATPGNPTQTAPSTTGQILRVVGHAYSADVLYFNPDNTFVELT
jgi:hypothetical protein